MTRTDYGSTFGYPEEDVRSHAIDVTDGADTCRDDRGFRLAFDKDRAQLANGGLWFMKGELGLRLFRQIHPSGGAAPTVGLRLTWTKEGA